MKMYQITLLAIAMVLASCGKSVHNSNEDQQFDLMKIKLRSIRLVITILPLFEVNRIFASYHEWMAT